MLHRANNFLKKFRIFVKKNLQNLQYAKILYIFLHTCFKKIKKILHSRKNFINFFRILKKIVARYSRNVKKLKFKNFFVLSLITKKSIILSDYF